MSDVQNYLLTVEKDKQEATHIAETVAKSEYCLQCFREQHVLTRV